MQHPLSKGPRPFWCNTLPCLVRKETLHALSPSTQCLMMRMGHSPGDGVMLLKCSAADTCVYVPLQLGLHMVPTRATSGHFLLLGVPKCPSDNCMHVFIVTFTESMPVLPAWPKLCMCCCTWCKQFNLGSWVQVQNAPEWHQYSAW